MARRAGDSLAGTVSIHQPRIPPAAVVMRVVSILGMGLTFSACLLALVGAEWIWALGMGLGFLPFLGMMYFVDRIMLATTTDGRAPRPRRGE